MTENSTYPMGNNFRKTIIITLAILALFLISGFGEILGSGLSSLTSSSSSSASSDRAFQREFELFQSQYTGGIIVKSTDKMDGERKNILVTGGTGYIGVHAIVCLLEAGYDVTVVDNLINSSPEGLKRAIEITKSDPNRVRFFQVDLLDSIALEDVFKNSPPFSACIHFAGLKAVGESVQKPILYYENNIGGTLNLLKLMSKYGCHSIIFSSSATVSDGETCAFFSLLMIHSFLPFFYGQ